MQHKLDIEDLNVETFTPEPIVADYVGRVAVVGIVSTDQVPFCQSGLFCY